MTGSAISGHKVKKLEFHFSEALKNGYKTVIGCGESSSNYCRSIAVTGKELGFHVHLVQCSNLVNFLTNRGIDGQPAYVLPAGFPGDPGIYAYIDTFHELFLQGVTKEFTDLVVSCDSGITTSAFIIGNYLTGGNLRVHALSTRESKMQCQMIIVDILEKCGFLQQVGDGIDIGDLVSIVESSREPKHGEVCDEHLGRTTVYKKNVCVCVCFFFERRNL
ncbi:hypothetical protein HOLleu_27203 [Holothuria leucospilota]|uniref:Uncharacterized protein n=1 Tax=Holothuria leucospilota TaxID=206669 RepID=A0A9Q1H256_HOLLE|nr:hypothetical protein HOLleu_27203 [Holothuria leucospilota]